MNQEERTPRDWNKKSCGKINYKKKQCNCCRHGFSHPEGRHGGKVVGKQTGTTWLESRLDMKGIFRYFQGGSVGIFRYLQLKYVLLEALNVSNPRPFHLLYSFWTKKLNIVLENVTGLHDPKWKESDTHCPFHALYHLSGVKYRIKWPLPIQRLMLVLMRIHG